MSSEVVPGAAVRADGEAFRADIEGLRAVAILLVVAGHLGLPWLPSGFIGVDVFFVISGYVITQSLLRRGEESSCGRSEWFRDFYARRIRRLLPAAILVLIVTAVLSALLLPGIAHRPAGLSIAASAAYVANFWFAVVVTSGAPATEIYGPVSNYWSLGVEEQFYLIWPLLLALVIGSGRSVFRVRRSGVGWLAGICAVSLAASVWLSTISPAWTFFLPLTRLWEMAIGGIIAMSAALLAGLTRRRLALAVSWAGLASIVGTAVWLDPRTAYPGWVALVPVAGTAAVIAAGVSLSADCGRWSVNALLAQSVPRQLGRWSYSWYLWHWPILVLGTLAWDRYASPGGIRSETQVWPWSPVLGVVLLLASLGLAAITYVFVEVPARWHPGWASSPQRTFAIGLGLTIAGIAAGLLLVLT